MIAWVLAGLCIAGTSEDVPDRTRAPAVAPPPFISLPEPEFRQIRPGLRVWRVPGKGMRDVHIRLSFRRGSLDLAQPGSASYSAFGWVWDQATRRRSANEVDIFEDLNEVDVATYSGLRNTTVTLSGTVSSWTEGLPLLREALLEPRFLRKDLRLIRDNRERWYLYDAPTLGYAIIEAVHDYAWYPTDHPFGAMVDLAGWDRLRRRQVRRRHADLLRAAPLDVLVSGDISWQDIESHLLPAVEGVGVDGSTAQGPLPLSPPDGSQVVAVDLGGTTRASLGLQLAAPLSTSDEFPVFVLVDHALGGSFLSRLNRELREERGLTYGIGSTYLTGQSRGVLKIETEVAVEHAGEAIEAIEAQLAGLSQGGLTEGELRDGRAAALATWNATFSSIDAVDRRYWGWLSLGRDLAYGRGIVQAVREVKPARTRQVAARWLGQDAPRLWVVVGNRRDLEPQLAELDLEVRWVPSELVVLGLGVAPAPGDGQE